MDFQRHRGKADNLPTGVQTPFANPNRAARFPMRCVISDLLLPPIRYFPAFVESLAALTFRKGVFYDVDGFPTISRNLGQSADVRDDPVSEPNHGYEFPIRGAISDLLPPI